MLKYLNLHAKVFGFTCYSDCFAAKVICFAAKWAPPWASGPVGLWARGPVGRAPPMGLWAPSVPLERKIQFF